MNHQMISLLEVEEHMKSVDNVYKFYEIGENF